LLQEQGGFVMTKNATEIGIYSLSLFLKSKKAFFSIHSDLIFLEGQPYAVLEWGGAKNNQYPLVKIKLDPARLEQTHGMEIDFHYPDPIDDPRSIQ
jgi:hypothetical protein